jgi:hypothetical protein
MRMGKSRDDFGQMLGHRTSSVTEHIATATLHQVLSLQYYSVKFNYSILFKS